jgi:hypothetical protein
MASIELTPDKPGFPAGGWHVSPLSLLEHCLNGFLGRFQPSHAHMIQVEGHLNERIVATALYYVDCENVTPSNLSFRMQTDSGGESQPCETEEIEYYAHIYGTRL